MTCILSQTRIAANGSRIGPGGGIDRSSQPLSQHPSIHLRYLNLFALLRLLRCLVLLPLPLLLLGTLPLLPCCSRVLLVLLPPLLLLLHASCC